MKNPKRTPVRHADQYGRHIVRVPLARGQGEAVVDAFDFDRLMSIGLTDQWLLNGYGNGYVRAGAAGTTGALVGVARTIVGVGRGKHVRYRDKNPLNLRRINLYVTGGKATRNDAEALVAAKETREARSAELHPARIGDRHEQQPVL